MPDFQYDNSLLENVTSHKYLGIMMHKNSKANLVAINLVTTATQAIFTLKKTLHGYTRSGIDTVQQVNWTHTSLCQLYMGIEIK